MDKEKCAECGTVLNIHGCLNCGAPVCCPKCCDDDRKAAYTKRLEDELADARETLKSIVDADWRTWQELASPEEFVRWAKSRANHALVRHNACGEPGLTEPGKD